MSSGRDQVALHDVAAQRLQHVALAFGFDAFGDHGHLQTLAEPDHSGDDRQCAGIAFDIAHETAVDLQFADRQMRQPAQA